MCFAVVATGLTDARMQVYKLKIPLPKECLLMVLSISEYLEM
ncbi:hypothetical protein X975_24906, partial [Stegodyphus mimosarum]